MAVPTIDPRIIIKPSKTLMSAVISLYEEELNEKDLSIHWYKFNQYQYVLHKNSKWKQCADGKCHSPNKPGILFLNLGC